mmetsp:Transcript_1592/g.3504  ORF Transcript_1592/g.3504 Transcript_1592/m.3504 type:complete len:487 (+) Transcript_1592:46-1506(+)
MEEDELGEPTTWHFPALAAVGAVVILNLYLAMSNWSVSAAHVVCLSLPILLVLFVLLLISSYWRQQGRLASRGNGYFVLHDVSTIVDGARIAEVDAIRLYLLALFSLQQFSCPLAGKFPDSVPMVSAMGESLVTPASAFLAGLVTLKSTEHTARRSWRMLFSAAVGSGLCWAVSKAAQHKGLSVSNPEWAAGSWPAYLWFLPSVAVWRAVEPTWRALRWPFLTAVILGGCVPWTQLDTVWLNKPAWYFAYFVLGRNFRRGSLEGRFLRFLASLPGCSLCLFGLLGICSCVASVQSVDPGWSPLQLVEDQLIAKHPSGVFSGVAMLRVLQTVGLFFLIGSTPQVSPGILPGPALRGAFVITPVLAAFWSVVLEPRLASLRPWEAVAGTCVVALLNVAVLCSRPLNVLLRTLASPPVPCVLRPEAMSSETRATADGEVDEFKGPANPSSSVSSGVGPECLDVRWYWRGGHARRNAQRPLPSPNAVLSV